MTNSLTINPDTICTQCNKPWHEHWGFNCDEPYADRKFRPLLPGLYPPNRGDRDIPLAIWRKNPPTVAEVEVCRYWWRRIRVCGTPSHAPPSHAPPQVIELDAYRGSVYYGDKDDGTMAPFDLEDHGGSAAEWCPCIPPITEEATEF